MMFGEEVLQWITRPWGRGEVAVGAGKSEVISFKADASMARALAGVANRSEFIRQAVLMALEHCCPLCGGNGVLTPAQRRHWRAFERDHGLEKCLDCHEPRLVCRRSDQPERAS